MAESLVTKINQYLYDVSRGMVKLNEKQVNQIVKIVNDHVDTIVVRKYRYNGVTNIYDLVREYGVHFEQVHNKVKIIKDSPQLRGFYMYEIKDLDFKYYSMNPNLFPKL